MRKYPYHSRGYKTLSLHGIRNGRCTCLKEACGSPGKHPSSKHGVKDASVNNIELADNHYQNIGIATGGGFFVVDIDPDKGGGDSLSDLEDQYGKLPNTVEAITGGNGRHLYFRTPVGTTIGNRVGMMSGIDIRGDGGYVVAPPSNHISGNTYEWEVSSSPFDIDMAIAPAWLVEMIITKPSITSTDLAPTTTGSKLSSPPDSQLHKEPYINKALNTAYLRVSNAIEGERNSVLNSEAYSLGQLVSGESLQKQIVLDVLRSAASVCGIDPTEATKTILSGLSAGSRKPRTSKTYPSPPIN